MTRWREASIDAIERWPWREVTTMTDEIEGLVKFKLLYRDAAGAPMVDQLWFTSNFDPARMHEELAAKTARHEASGATFPEDAAWV